MSRRTPAPDEHGALNHHAAEPSPRPPDQPRATRVGSGRSCRERRDERGPTVARRKATRSQLAGPEPAVTAGRGAPARRATRSEWGRYRALHALVARDPQRHGRPARSSKAALATGPTIGSIAIDDGTMAAARPADDGRTYFSSASLRPSTASFRLAPLVALLSSITTPLSFCSAVASPPLTAVPPAPAAR